MMLLNNSDSKGHEVNLQQKMLASHYVQILSPQKKLTEPHENMTVCKSRISKYFFNERIVKSNFIVTLPAAIFS